jgi:hypothetical protein
VLAFLAAAALSLVNAAIGLADANSDDPQSVGDYTAVLVFSAALLGSVAALVFLRGLLARTSPHATRLGLVVAALGLLTAATMVLTKPPPWRWVSVALVLLAVGFAVGEEPGFVLVALTCPVLALRLVPAMSHTRAT